MQTATHEQTWIDGLNRGDVSVADKVFAPDCVIHVNGSPDRNLGVAGFKAMVAGLLAAFPDLHAAAGSVGEYLSPAIGVPQRVGDDA